jgi:hypothetical protein
VGLVCGRVVAGRVGVGGMDGVVTNSTNDEPSEEDDGERWRQARWDVRSKDNLKRPASEGWNPM